MQEILDNKEIRRHFWVATISLLLLLGLIKFVLVGTVDANSQHWKIFTSGVIESLIATILTTIAIGSYIFYLTPRLDPGHKVNFLPSKDFNDHFESAMASAKEWHFRGGLGRYLSSVVLPEMNKMASKKRSPVTVRAQILDPRNDALCEMHAQLRNSVSSEKNDEKWTAFDIRVSLYSTIVTCAIFESNNSYLDVSLFLINYFSTDRVDVATSSGIVTKDDRNIPGIRFGRDSVLYDSYLGDLAVTQKQGDIVKPLSKPYRIGDIKENDVTAILSELGFASNKLEKAELASIALDVNSQIDPYGQ